MLLDRLSEATDRGVAFLKTQLLAGHYGLSCVGSDGTPRFSHNKGHVFTGFFIAEALADRLTEVERTVLLVRILSEEQEGLWGFSPPGPNVGPEHEVFIVDADDTAYVLRTLRRLDVNRSPERLLAFHRPDANVFTTFNAPGPTRLVLEPRADHNLLAHPEVNANVFLAIRGTRFERYINDDIARDLQASDGHWPAFYYPSPLFATALYVELIHGRGGFTEVERRAVAFLEQSQNANGSWGEPGDPYETSLAVNALAACGRFGQPLALAVTYLLDTMKADGSWQTDRCIWEFHASSADVWRAYDSHRTFASALCTRALTRALASACHQD